jgi:hypothetical protein
MSENMKIWNAVKQPPAAALKKIAGGRLSGMTDIKPQWRYQAMTEQFGPCGIGWKFTIEKLWTEAGSDGQIVAFANVNLYVAYRPEEGGKPEWSDPIPGNGGSMLVAKESKGPYTSDEAYKMAITDALSTAMKLLGVAADVYLGNWDGSKFRETKETIKITPDPVDEDKVFKASVWFKEMIDADQFELNWEKVQNAWKRLSNNERMEVDAKLQDKAPDSNQMYKNLLKKYLSYVPEQGV